MTCDSVIERAVTEKSSLPPVAAYLLNCKDSLAWEIKRPAVCKKDFLQETSDDPGTAGIMNDFSAVSASKNQSS